MAPMETTRARTERMNTVSIHMIKPPETDVSGIVWQHASDSQYDHWSEKVTAEDDGAPKARGRRKPGVSLYSMA